MNSILVDFKLFKDWQFPQILSEETGEVWTALECHSNKFYGGKINTLRRFFWFFYYPLQRIIRRRKGEKIIAWQQFFGLNYAFWNRLLHLRKKNDLTVLTFIYKQKHGFLGKLFHKTE